MGVNVYEIVTNRILEELEKGLIPWQKPWTGVRTGAYSRSTGRPYSVLNQLLLFKPGEYLTFKQALDAGGCVRKGEKASFVVSRKRKGCFRITVSIPGSASSTPSRTGRIIRPVWMKSTFHCGNSFPISGNIIPPPSMNALIPPAMKSA